MRALPAAPTPRERVEGQDTIMASKLNERSAWLLRFMYRIKPRRFYLYKSLPSDAPLGIDVFNVRGLQRARLIKDCGNGLFEIELRNRALHTFQAERAQLCALALHEEMVGKVYVHFNNASEAQERNR
jgi:hypothetical protein